MDTTWSATLFAGLLLVAGCGEVTTSDQDAASTDAGQAGIDAGADGGAADGPDAALVACQDDDDCATPPDSCHLVGTCNAAQECEFPELDCSAMDSECTTGVCQDGLCLAQPIAEGQPCGPGTTCDDFGACGDFDTADPCDETGQRTRSCQDSTCTAGVCTAGAAYQETEPCTRDQDGVTCASDSTSCSNCSFFGGDCVEQGARVCTTKTFTCQDATCTESSSSASEVCTRDTDGILCDTQSCPGGGIKSICCSSGTCSASCGGCL